MARIFFSIFFFAVLCSCAPSSKIRKALQRAEVQFQDHVGLLVYDPQTKKPLVDFNSEKYFTPASNTKIFTLLSGLQLVGDSIPALKYIEKGDSLIFWGTGDPSFLYPGAFQNDRTYNFLANHPAQLFFSMSNYFQEHFGPGWAWDDYNYSYSSERSAFPIYGNCLSITDSVNGSIKVFPALFQDSVKALSSMVAKKQAVRSYGGNSINYYAGKDTTVFSRQIPFHVTHGLIVSLLQDTLHRKVTLINSTLPSDSKILYSVPSDSLYKVMMQESDNFIAEQLLQLCSGILSDSLKSIIAVEYVKKNFLFDLPDEPQWVDGSGLSRYNLFTPRSIVKMWDKILVLKPKKELFELLAIGGKAGTIKNSYFADPPYIYGKTGTLSNNHCLSGYLITKKDRLLIFSFMNNNFTASTQEVRAKMEEILFDIHEKY